MLVRVRYRRQFRFWAQGTKACGAPVAKALITDYPNCCRMEPDLLRDLAGLHVVDLRAEREVRCAEQRSAQGKIKNTS